MDAELRSKIELLLNATHEHVITPALALAYLDAPLDHAELIPVLESQARLGGSLQNARSAAARSAPSGRAP